MHFPRFFIFFLSASVLSLAFAGPIPRPVGDSTDLAARDEEFALENRALNRHQVGQRAAQTVKAQATKKQAKIARTQQNKVVKPPPRAVAKASRAAALQAKAKTPYQKVAKKAAQVARRKTRAATGQPKGPARTPPRPRLSAADKAQVKNHMRQTGTAYRALANKPGRRDTFTNGAVTRTGKDARVATFNSLLHKNAPVGAVGGRGGMPAPFRNHPVNGVRPLPGAPTGRNNGLTEYPVKSGSRAGYQGPGDRGKVRAIIGNGRFEGLVNHPAGPRSGVHQGMTWTRRP